MKMKLAGALAIGDYIDANDPGDGPSAIPMLVKIDGVRTLDNGRIEVSAYGEFDEYGCPCEPVLVPIKQYRPGMIVMAYDDKDHEENKLDLAEYEWEARNMRHYGIT
jgi:hypothetical protein